MESKYLKIRNELNELGYTQYFSKDSIYLIDKLLGDLKTTTLSLQKYMKIAQDALEEKDNLELGAEPYKCDNAKLIKECNELHLAFLQFKEQNEKIQRDLKRQINKLELEQEEGYIDKQKLRKRIRDLEIEIVEQGKIVASAQDKKTVRSSVRSKSTSTVKDSVKSQDFTKAMAITESKIKNLTHEIKELKDQKLKLIDRVKCCESQIENRDKEIERLMGLVEGGRPLKVLNRDCCYKEVDNKCQALHDHIHKLKEEKLILEGSLKDAVNKQHEAMRRALHLAERNKQLEKELKDIDQIALAVEAECNDAVKSKADTVTRLQDRVNESVILIQNLERDTARLKQDKIELSSDLDALKLEKKHLQQLLDKESEDRKGLMDRVNNFTIIEHDLNMEIDRLVRLSGEHKRRIAELECLISSEKLKSYEFIPEAYKRPTKDMIDKSSTAEIPFSQKSRQNEGCIKCPSSPSKSKSLKAKFPASSKSKPSMSHKPACKKSTCTATTTTTVRRDLSTITENLGFPKPTSVRSVDKLPYIDKADVHCGSESCLKYMRDLLAKEIDNRQEQAIQMIESLKQEKEYYMKEYLRLMEELKNKSDQTDKFDDLMKKLKECECTIKYLQHTSSAKKDRSNISMRTDYGVTSELDSNSSRFNQTLKRKEREVELLRTDLQRVEEECDCYRKKYHNLLADTDNERERAKKAFADMENHIEKLEDERRDLVISQNTHRSSIHQMEDNQKSLREQLRSIQEELTIAKANYNQLKNLHDQSDRTIADLQNKLLRAETELSNSKMQLKSTDKVKTVSETQIATLSSDIQIMKTQLSKLDKEKDELLNALDDKTESNAVLEDQLKSKTKLLACIESEKNELKRKLSYGCIVKKLVKKIDNDLKNEASICCSCQYEDENLMKDGEVRSSRQELISTQTELDSERKTKDALQKENRRLQDELASVTTDCKKARCELECLYRQVDDLKRQLQFYVTEIKRTEDLISQKEVERNELLDQFKNLSQEAIVLESNNHTLESESNQNKVQLSVALDHAADLERKIEDKDSVIKSYEKQISSLTSQLAHYELQTKQKETNEERIAEEAKQMRDLCVKMDQEKDNLQRDMLRRDDEILKIQRALDKLRSENKELQCRLNKDHDNTEGLEKLLTEARQDILNQRLENQDLQHEICRLKSDITDLQERLKSDSSSAASSSSTSSSSHTKKEVIKVTQVHKKVQSEIEPKNHPVCCDRCDCQKSLNEISSHRLDNLENFSGMRPICKKMQLIDKKNNLKRSSVIDKDLTSPSVVSPCDKSCIRDLIKNVEAMFNKSNEDKKCVRYKEKNTCNK